MKRCAAVRPDRPPRVSILPAAGSRGRRCREPLRAEAAAPHRGLPPQAGDPGVRDRRRRGRPGRLGARLRRALTEEQGCRHAALALPHGLDHQALRRDGRHAARREGADAARRAHHDVPALLQDGGSPRADDHHRPDAHAHLRHAGRRRLRVGQAAVRRQAHSSDTSGASRTRSSSSIRASGSSTATWRTRSWATPWRRPRECRSRTTCSANILQPLAMSDSTLLVTEAEPALMTWGHELDGRGRPFASACIRTTGRTRRARTSTPTSATCRAGPSRTSTAALSTASASSRPPRATACGPRPARSLRPAPTFAARPSG